MSAKDKKQERMETKPNAEAEQQIEQASASQGCSFSDFVVLTVDESITLAELMMAEPEANQKSVAAMDRYKNSGWSQDSSA